MQKPPKNTLDKISLTIIIITIILLNIFIGSNIKQPIWIIQSIVTIYTLTYILTKKIQKEKNIIIKGKIDIAILIFMISTTLPYILKKYTSLEGTINFILKYWSIYSFYILARNIINNKAKTNKIINTIIISSIIPIIFGFDKLTFNIFEPFLNSINAVKITDTRMVSTFGYPNTYAVYLTITTTLAIAQFLNTNQKHKKIPYGIYIIFSTLSIILTQSKSMLALIAIIILTLIIINIKNKKIPKKWIITGIILISAFFIYFFIAIQIPKPLKIEEQEKTCVIRGIENNSEYELEFEIEAKTDKQYDTFEINIVEITRYFSEKTIGRITFSNFSGTKKINIKTDEPIDHIELRITNKLNQELTIKNFKINGRTIYTRIQNNTRRTSKNIYNI